MTDQVWSLTLSLCPTILSFAQNCNEIVKLLLVNTHLLENYIANCTYDIENFWLYDGLNIKYIIVSLIMKNEFSY